MKSSIRKTKKSQTVIPSRNISNEHQADDDMNIEVKDNHVILCAPQNAKREGWAEAFKEMAANGDDQLVMPDVFNDEESVFFQAEHLPQHVLDGIKRGEEDIVAGRYITFEEFKKRFSSYK